MLVPDSAVGTGTSTPDSIPAIKNTYIKHPAIHQPRKTSGLCSAVGFDAATLSTPLAERRTFGHATDQAVSYFPEGLGSASELCGMWPDRFELGFDGRNEFMVTQFTLSELRGSGVCLLQ
ncbi:P-type ATPase-like protein [Apiospora rasikravindrae]|uniref:P-type ATPase-like protein n=1 Tax=Apiospora rasikravindrae TaxID=990691 RepID=A0ABR1SD57_9PEZI